MSAPPQKIDLNATYPCPCCRQGQLKPIMLTEALGCDRCHQILALTPDHLMIEQLAVPNPYRKVWSWQGKHWVLSKEGAGRGLLTASAVGVFTAILTTSLLAWRLSWGLEIFIWLMVILAICIAIVFLAVLTLQRF